MGDTMFPKAVQAVEQARAARHQSNPAEIAAHEAAHAAFLEALAGEVMPALLGG
jgi:hypothetical protein